MSPDTTQLLISAGWTFLLRPLTAIIVASPTYLAGVLTAALLRAMVGPATVRQSLGRGTLPDLLRAWVFTMALPICSFGVLPLLRELRAMRVSRRILIVTALSPVVNFWSIAYGLFQMPWPHMLLLTLLAALLSIGAAWFWAPVEPAEGFAVLHPDDEPPAATITGRMLATARAAGKLLTDSGWIDVLVGLIACGLVATLTPEGAVADLILERHPWTLLAIGGIALPSYVLPDVAIAHAYQAWRMGVVPGAGFLFLVFGAGINLGLFAWISRTFGIKPLIRFIAVVLLPALVMAYGADALLTRANSAWDDIDSLNDYSRSPHVISPGLQGLHQLGERLIVATGPNHLIALAILGALAACSLATRRRPDRSRRPSSNTTAPQAISVRALNAASAGIVAIFLAISLYIYFPNADDGCEAMFSPDAYLGSGVTSGQRDNAAAYIEQLRAIVHRVEVGQMLRLHPMTPAQRQAAEAYLHSLAELQTALAGKDNAAAQTANLQNSKAFHRYHNVMAGT
ncbi:MAG TPA: permease [Phycisphaerae bacterium]|nr:permease [Phycisphaerae bacterium]